MAGPAGGMSGGVMFELFHTPVHPHALEQVTAAAYDNNEELLWVGTERGGLHTYLNPTMERYSSVTGHTSRVQGMVSTPAGVLSVSSNRLRLHSPGGLPLLSYTAPLEEAGTSDMLSCDADMHAGRAMVGRKDSALALHDLASGKLVSKFEVPGEAIVIRYPAGRGLVAVGCLGGSVALCDPRSNHRVERTIVPHAGGLTALDVKGDLLATAGMQIRMGQLSLDTLVQVYDIRGAPRAVSHIPFGAGPTMLRFQPMFTSMLMIGSASGIFMTSDIQGTGITTSNQVLCEGGDMVTAASISSSGEMMAFGTVGGFIHVWGSSEAPKVNHFSRQTEFASPPPQQKLNAADSASVCLADVPRPFCLDGRPLSEWEPGEVMSVGLPPRIVDPALLKDLKQVDFVGYVSNPKFSRSLKPGESAWKASPYRNQRVPISSGNVDKRLERASSKGTGIQLPGRYHKMEIRELQSHVRFEEFDFSFYNRTKFAGLENNMANCYCNPLIQVLYFLPMMRAYLLQHVPDPDHEFSLTCEAAFLFRMLLSGPLHCAGATCQAANLLRSLRQIREASMLGLLEGHRNESSMKGSRGDIEVETHKERSLSRRVQSLSRFLLEHLHREVVAPGSSQSPISNIFGIEYRQRMQVLGGSKAEALRDGRSFQVELQYPHQSKRQEPKLAAADKPRPSFASLLSSSLRTQADLKAWFDERHGYQVIVVSCGMQDRGDIAWWMPISDGKGGERPWLPWAVEVETKPETWEVDVAEVPMEQLAARAKTSDGIAGEEGTRTKAVYVLTAMIVHVQGYCRAPTGFVSLICRGPSTIQETGDLGADGKTSGEGHVVAHVKVLPHDIHPAPEIGSPALNSMDLAGTALQLQPPTARAASPPLSAEQQEEDAVPSSNEGMEAQGGYPGLTACPATQPSKTLRPCSSPPLLPAATFASLALGDPNSSSANLPPLPSATTKTGNALSLHWEGRESWESGWLICNDFCIVPCTGEEVLRLYDLQKVPCLLYYTDIAAIQAFETNGREDLSKMSQILSAAQFSELCNAPPLQRHILQKETFRPLDIRTEPPRPGMLLAIDAEFVMFSPEEKVADYGVETVTRPARLGLARISVLRGDPGPCSGDCCIDDYVRTVEPVFDYLTRFSGLMHGDLDPSASKHYLTTLKRAYMKLRYLVDTGCVFIGHGLKKDFHMINIDVPPGQVIDTVELFYLKRQRKLSLRFLASYLLGIDIQQHTHDSIEDARTALRLYEAYTVLQKAGKVEEKLQEIYRWGRERGWDPVSPGTVPAVTTAAPGG